MTNIKNVVFKKIILTFKNIERSDVAINKKYTYTGEIYFNDKKMNEERYFAKNLKDLKKQLYYAYKITADYKHPKYYE